MSDCLICVLKDINNEYHQEWGKESAAERLIELLPDIIGTFQSYGSIYKELEGIHSLASSPYAGGLQDFMQRLHVRTSRAMSYFEDADED